MVIKTISKGQANQPFSQQNAVDTFCIGRLSVTERGERDLFGIIAAEKRDVNNTKVGLDEAGRVKQQGPGR